MDIGNFKTLITEHGEDNLRYVATTSGKSWMLHSDPGVKARYDWEFDEATGLIKFTHRVPDSQGPDVRQTVEYTEVSQVEIVCFFPPQ